MMVINSINEIYDIGFEKIKNKKEYLSSLYITLGKCKVLLEKQKENLAVEQAKETGKPVKYCYIEVERCIIQLNQAIEYLRKEIYLNDIAQKKKYLKSIPIGVVLGITTFSSPYSSFIHKIIPALICGNIFVFVPSPKTYKCSMLLFDLFEKISDIVKKRVYCVDVRKIKAFDIVEKLKFDYILFTGKSETAALIKRKIGYKHGVFETGSNAMAYVDMTVKNLDSVAQQLVEAAFSQSGMRCIGLKNLFIHKAISEVLLQKIVALTKKIECGNPLDSMVMVGPIYDKEMLESLIENISLLKKSGYNVLSGARVEDSNLLLPTILQDVSNNFYSLREMYGPVLCIHVVDGFEEIDEDYFKRSSLNTAIFSDDLAVINRFIEHCDTCGTICVNFGPDKRDDELPFGGLFDENDGKENLESLIKVLSIEQRIVYENTAV